MKLTTAILLMITIALVLATIATAQTMNEVCALTMVTSVFWIATLTSAVDGFDETFWKIRDYLDNRRYWKINGKAVKL